LTLSKPQTYREFVPFPPIIFNNDLCSRLAVFVYAHEIVFFFGGFSLQIKMCADMGHSAVLNIKQVIVE
jgi:hypothetical protein